MKCLLKDRRPRYKALIKFKLSSPTYIACSHAFFLFGGNALGLSLINCQMDGLWVQVEMLMALAPGSRLRGAGRICDDRSLKEAVQSTHSLASGQLRR